MTIMPQWLTKRAMMTPDREAVVLSDDTRYTFKELDQHAGQYAYQLKQQGTNKTTMLLYYPKIAMKCLS